MKIAASVVPTEVDDRLQHNRFEELLASARNQAKHVVVEGIEGIEGLNTAALSGAQWVQGYHTGKPERLRKAKCSTVGSVEQAMRQFERVANALIDRQDEKRSRDDAMLAYAFGLSSALYGRHSAIATGLRNGLLDVMQLKSGNSNISVQFLQCFVVLGRLNGQTLVGPFGSRAFRDTVASAIDVEFFTHA
ncbi:hypothetical protein [Burkholderia cenocepacia]|uniref:hypothetical protein n=1 Tax=Burkholderia cenocepacia TaxID=95486 RepID=UPI0026552280|nr:hypothetical protein [Burkholderia cenocepacia]MDN7459048.1 hypothetical protein [Burkholderia cenocepacia]